MTIGVAFSDFETLEDERAWGARSTNSRTETQAKVYLTLAMWGSTFVVFTSLSLLDPNRPIWPAAGMRAVIMLLGVAFCFGLHCLLRSMASRRFSTRAVTLIIAAPLVAEIFAWLNYFGFAWLEGGQMAFVVEDWNAAIRQLLLYTWFFIAWTGLYLAIEYSFLARAEQQRGAQLEIHAHRAKLRALSNQINPHFLFNSLNSISALVLEGERRDADKALGLLSSYFRRTLSLDPLLDVALQQELDLHSVYLAVEKLRYPDLEVSIKLPDHLREAAIPALILQPVIENAVTHGIARSRPPTYLRIEARAEDGSLELRVINGGEPEAGAPPAEGHGMGLSNVRDRLRERYGAEQRVTTEAAPERFETTIALPLVLP